MSNPTNTTSPLYCPPDQVPAEGQTIYSTYIHARSKPDYKIDHETGCWNWIKGLSPHGYPTGYAHRLYYERAYGVKVPKGDHMHHTCENPRCVNPEHLEHLTSRQHRERHLLVPKGLTVDDYHEMRRLIAIVGRDRPTYYEIADQFGVDVQTVYHTAKAWHWPQLGGAVELPERVCEREDCDEVLGPEKQRNAVYCSKKCRLTMNGRRTWERTKARRAAA